MQILFPHKNICRIYSMFPPEETKSEQRKLYEEQVKNWEDFHKYGMPDKLKQQKLHISRATYYRSDWKQEFLRVKLQFMSGKANFLKRLKIRSLKLEKSIQPTENQRSKFYSTN